MKLRSKIHQLLFLTLAVGVVMMSAGSPRIAQGQVGGGAVAVTGGALNSVTTLFKDITAQAIANAAKIAAKAKEVAKTQGDVAFKSSIQMFENRLYQEVQNQLSAAGSGQTPLFITKPLTFFKNVGEAAAGDYIDQYVKAYTGGEVFGGDYSTARSKFLLSRFLRTQANLQITGATNECIDNCNGSYSADANDHPSSDGSVFNGMTAAKWKETTGFANEHEKKSFFITADIYASDGTEVTEKNSPNQIVDCLDITKSGQGPIYTYTVTIGANLGSDVTAAECLNAQEQARNLEREAATNDLLQCTQTCQVGNTLATQATTAATQTDVTSSLQNMDATKAPAAIANALAENKSDLGQFLTAAGAMTATIQEKVTGEQTNLNPNTLPKSTPVSREVTTPSAAVSSLFGVPITTDQSQNAYTGSTLADILKGITSFINSPIGRAIIGYYKSKCGLNPAACKGPSNATSKIGQLVFGNGAPTGVAGAQLAYAALGQAQIIIGNPGQNDIQVTDELASAGLIDSQFRQAIDDSDTVQQALDQHLLDPQKTFGFDKSGNQPSHGYPFRALQYLRKYRIIPVGWELAAKYSQQFDHRDLSLGYLIGQYNICGQDTSHKVCSRGPKSGQSCQVDNDCGIQDKVATPADPTITDASGAPIRVDANNAVVTCGASPYCGLVDPNWVLEAPQTYCRRQGAGEEIITKEFVCDTNNVDATSGKPIPAGETCSANSTSGCTDVAAANCVYHTNTNEHPDMGRWEIVRNTDTCADVQSCISENADGTCLAYGYCVQERPDFKFNGTQCSAQNSSCASYTDQSGQLVGYLTNTLDSQNCTADNAGCKKYCAAPSYDPTSQQCNGNDSINFTGKVQSCDQTQVGCSQFLSMANGANMIANSGFETYDQPLDGANSANFSGWSKGNVCSTDPNRICSSSGDCGGGTCLTTLGAYPISSTDTSVTAKNVAALRLTGGTHDNMSQVVHTGYDLYERSFTFSVRAKADASCSATMILEPATNALNRPRVPNIGDGNPNMAVTSGWATYSVTLSIPNSSVVTVDTYDLRATVRLDGCATKNLVIDSAQLEESSAASTYKDYGSTNAVYLNGQRQSCTAADVGCQVYTPVAGGTAVDGQVRDSNRCSPNSVGCTSLVMEQTTNVPIRSEETVNAVVPKGTICSAAEVGCEEYTNLDVVAQGGEGKEYYSTIRQCVKPSQVNAVNPVQATYYTWVGDAKLGYVLRSYDLVKTNFPSADPEIAGAPCTSLKVGSISANPTCNDTATTITAAKKNCASVSDLASNADCTQFYDSALRTYYRLRSHTISITNDCTPYRNSIDQSSNNPATQNNVYYVSTQESTSCSAAAAGCRAYTGNASGTTRKVFSDDFETSASSNWTGGQASNAATSVNGHSILIPVTGTSVAAVTNLGVLNNQIKAGRTYSLSFTAAAASATPGNISAAFGTMNGTTFTPYKYVNSSLFSTFQLPGGGGVQATWNTNITPPGPEWHTYTLVTIPQMQDYPNAQLGIMVSGGSVYIDNVTLTEVNDHLYMISNSLPMCTDAEVGCAAYKDGSGVTNYLTSFARLCSEQVVGCQALIDTQNSTSPFAQTVKGVTTPADTVVTLINSPANYCPAAAKGCGVFGKPTYGPDQTVTSYQSTYLINDPDRYSADLCQDNELACQVFTDSNGTAAYFKDPGTNVCDYRTGVAGSGGWYITGTSLVCPTVTPPTAGRPVGASCSPVCGSGSRQGKACQTNSDCPGSTTGNQCVGNAATIGKVVDASGDIVVGQCASSASCASACVGGALDGTLCNRNADCGANSTCQRNSCIYLAGSCPTDQNSCTEYRDPTDPQNCRSNCALTSTQGGTPDLLDATCQPTKCADGKRQGQNCQTDDDCFDGSVHQCVGGNNQPTTGIAGCRSYYFLGESLQSSSSTCNGTVNVANGCLPFNNTTNPSLNFVGR